MEDSYNVVIKNGRQQEAAEVDMSANLKTDAIREFDPGNRQYSTYLSDAAAAGSVDYDTLENLAISPQSSLDKTVQIIRICRQYTNKNDIIGATVEAIENNLNTDIRLVYKAPKRGSVKKTDIEAAKVLIDDFNEQIKLDKLIAKAVLTTFIDGTFISYMRKKDNEYVVDYYPVGAAVEVSDYDIGGDPYVVVNMKSLRDALQKTYPKTKKRKALFFEDMAKEIQANYPDEVQKAYHDAEAYAILNVENTGVLRINNQNKKYGLSPIFRAMYPILMLEAFDKADRTNAKARAKKIIALLMNKEILGEHYERDSYAEQAYAHKNFLDAWRQDTVVSTMPATVRDVKYVEPKVEMTSADTINYYRQRAMATLGVTFLLDGGSSSSAVANISLKQLMKRINKISRQLEEVVEKWYKIVLRDNGLDPSLAPTITVIDSEMLEMSMKTDLANTLFTKLNCSYETAFETLGMSLEDEKIRREKENKEGIEDIFAPRVNTFTTSGTHSGGSSATGNGPARGSDNHGGRPAANDDDSIDPEKRDYDAQRYADKKNGGG